MKKPAKKTLYEMARDPARWDDDFFKAVAGSDERTLRTLTSIVKREFPDHLERLMDGWAEGSILNDRERLSDSIKRVRVPSAADFESKAVEWIYNPFIPKGKLTLIAANPGVGKTFLMCYISACVTTGRPIFRKDIILDGQTVATYTEGQEYAGGKPGKVLYITAEDSAADTIRPRLEWCGADLTKVYIKECEAEAMTYDSTIFRDILEALQPDMVICDPFQSFFSEKVDINAPNKTRAQLFPVIRLAAETGAAIVLVCHLNKNAQGGIITRVLGSMDIVGACRSFLAVGNVPGKAKGLKFISHEKSSLARAGATYRFRLDSAQGGVVVLGESDLKFDDYSALERSMRKGQGQKTAEAKQFLMEHLQKGPRSYKDLLKAAQDKNISEWALGKAADDLGITKERKGFGKGSFWNLPKCEAADRDNSFEI